MAKAKAPKAANVGPVTKERKGNRGNPAKGPSKIFGKWMPSARIRNVKSA